MLGWPSEAFPGRSFLRSAWVKVAGTFPPPEVMASSLSFVVGRIVNTFWGAMVREVDKRVKILRVLAVWDTDEPGVGLRRAIVPHQMRGSFVSTVSERDKERQSRDLMNMG
jgi:hypothetical protein